MADSLFAYGSGGLGGACGAIVTIAGAYLPSTDWKVASMSERSGVVRALEH